MLQVFLGTLRDIEKEMVRERLSSAVMESLLALTIFREEFNSFFISMFGGLVFLKVLHWLVQDRVDYVEVTPNLSRLQHVRIISLMVALLVRDAMRTQCRVLSRYFLFHRFLNFASMLSFTTSQLVAALQFIDSLFLQYTVQGTIQSGGQSVLLLFAFEYVIQASNVVRYFLKYVMSTVDLYLDGRWESKVF